MSIANYTLNRLDSGKWILLANACQSALSFAILMSLVRLGTKEDVGTFAFVQGLLLPIQLFFTLKLRTVECSDVETKYSLDSYHNTRRVAASGSFAVGLVVLLFVEDKYFWPGLFLLFSYSLLIVRESYGSNLIKVQKGLGFFLISTVHAAFSVLSVVVTFVMTSSLIYTLLALFLSRLISYLAPEKYIFRAQTNAKLPAFSSINLSAIKTLVILAFPLGLTALVGALFTSIPRFLVEDNLGVEPLAVYATITSLLFVFNLFVNSYVQSELPLAAQMYWSNKSGYIFNIARSIAKVLVISVALALLFYVFGEYVLALLFGEEYRLYKKELLSVVFAGATLSLFSIGNLLLSSQRNFAVQLRIYISVALLIFMAVYFGVRHFGISGAIMGQGFAYLVGFLICFMVFISKAKVHVRNPKA